LTTILTPSLTETAIANGDTRTIHLYHAHTQESISATYLVSGRYDQAVLQQLNWFLRDWRRDEPTNMDPRLFDVVWEAYRHAGAGEEVVKVVSAYRSPETNAMLRSRSRAVAKYSQHMLGKAMDTTMPGMPMSHVREIGMRMQRGGVGYYPTAGTPFVHLDVGSVRSWPRMTYDQLARLFPDGKTVHLPSNGQPLARYEEARAEIEARNNGAYVTAPSRSFGGFLASLFGGGAEEDEDAGYVAPAPSTRKQWAALAPRMSKAQRTAAGEEGEEGAAPEPRRGRGRPEQIASAEANLPRGETAMSAAPAQETAAPAQETAAPKAEQPEAAAEKPVAIRAPLPPRRPASLDAGRRSAVAALEPAENAGQDANASADREPAPPKTVRAPLPPRRPTSLVASAAPTPPARPVETARVEPKAVAKGAASKALASLMDATGSTRRGKARTPPPAAEGASQVAPAAGEPADDASRPPALAYAPPAKAAEDKPSPLPEDAAAAPRPAPAQPGTAKPAASESNAAAAQTGAPGTAVFGSAMAGLRSALRAAEPK